MKQAVLFRPRQFDIVEVPIPVIAANELLVRVAYCGVCTSEVDVWSGSAGQEKFPYYQGHEVSGYIVDTGKKVSTFKEDDPVGVWVPGGGFAEYVVVKPENSFLAGNIPLKHVLTEPIACAVNAVELTNISLADDVVIIGAGFMGNLVQQLVELQGPRYVIVADTRQDALDRAKQLGATRTVNVSHESLQEVVQQLTEGRGADVTFEVTGVQKPLLLAGEVTRTSGKIALVGYHQGTIRELPLGYWNYMAFQIINAHFRNFDTIRRGMYLGMRLLTADRLSLEKLVTHSYPLEEIGRAFQDAYDKPLGFAKATINL